MKQAESACNQFKRIKKCSKYTKLCGERKLYFYGLSAFLSLYFEPVSEKMCYYYRTFKQMRESINGGKDFFGDIE